MVAQPLLTDVGMRALSALAIVVFGIATSAAAQTPPRTSCRIVGTDVTCTNLHPVSEAAATAILTVAIAPFVPDPPAPVIAPFVGELHPIHGEVFSDRWPYEAAGVYPWLLPHGLVPRRLYASPFAGPFRGWQRAQ
jgi:hypothetical protein